MTWHNQQWTFEANLDNLCYQMNPFETKPHMNHLSDERNENFG